ncbi:Tetranectin [Heterocephalus glaber]|uniref:Tetranectin n=1 Tax=Heterocephalus glaber TaxID=10181 RepID=G5ANN0_HETGA|nr:tetranectin [Heterocephalus glaber]EHA98640.1 Tetranectin [Heterocephalus glaber]
MELLRPRLLLCVLAFLTQGAAEPPTSKPKKAANARKDLVSPKMIAELQGRLDSLAQEVAVLKEQQALQTVCLKGAKVHLKCFLVVAQALAFHAAGEDCIARGGTLAAPRSEAENEALREYAARSLGAAAELWLGLHDLGSEGAWVDASGAPAAFTHWESEITAQPDGGAAENCAAMAGAAHGRWFDRRCRDALPYACQFAIV